jgi:hypothetical protein
MVFHFAYKLKRFFACMKQRVSSGEKLVKIHPTLHETAKFITMLIETHHQTLN